MKFLTLPPQVMGLDGRPVVGALLQTYVSGTSTPKATYADAGLTVPHPNPLVADQAGRWAAAYMASGLYKVVVSTAAGAVIATYDPVEGDAAASAGAGGDFTSLNGGPLGSFRNALVNPEFLIDQRVGTAAGALGYIADYWLFDSLGGTRVMSRPAVADQDRSAIGRDGLRFMVRYAATGGAAATNFERLSQRIDGARTFAGRQATLSFWAKRQAGAGDIATDMEQFFGAGGTPSPTVTGIGAAKHTLAAFWQKFVRAINVPTIIGKSFGDDRTDYLGVNFWISAGSDFVTQTSGIGAQTVTVDIADVQLEIGGLATPLEVRPIATELAFCERRYEKSYDLHVAPGFAALEGAVTFGTQSGAISAAVGYAQFRTRKRILPTVTVYNPVTGAVGEMRDVAGTNSATTLVHIGQSGFAARNNAVLGANNTAMFQFVASSDF